MSGIVPDDGRQPDEARSRSAEHESALPGARNAEQPAHDAVEPSPAAQQPALPGAHDAEQPAHDAQRPARDAAQPLGNLGAAPNAEPNGLVWHRMHPVTPLVRGWSVLAVLVFVVAQQNFNNVSALQAEFGMGLWWRVLLGIGVVAVFAFLYAALAWRRLTYAVDSESVRLHSGVLFHQQRRARLDRLQAVDIVQPLLARMFGLAELKLEVAGGGGSGIRLGFLPVGEAQRLRNELLALAAGIKRSRATSSATPAGGPPPATTPVTHGPTGTGPGTAPTGVGHQSNQPSHHLDHHQGHHPTSDDPPLDLGALEAPEQTVTEVDTGRLIGSIALSSATVFLVLVVIGTLAGTIAAGDISIAFGLLPAVLGVGGYMFNRFTGEFSFRSAISPDGIRLRHGLLETRSQTIPPGRVQAIKISQTFLWRRAGWWRVTINVAGYAFGDGNETQNTTVLLPVGTQQQALDALWLVLPDLGSPDPLGVCEEGLKGLDRGTYFTTQPRRSRILDLISWRRNGFAVTDRALLVRGGRVFRYLVVVPHERTQSLGVTQGPLQRTLRVASFALHSTPGPVAPRIAHLDAGDAMMLLDTQAARARTARAQAGPELWMERDFSTRDFPNMTRPNASEPPFGAYRGPHGA